MGLVVDKPGLQTTLQDLGRRGLQHLGVAVAGAMDPIAHRLASWLVGNDADVASLEVTLLGPALRFEQPAVVAVAGADLGAAIDGVALPPHEVALVPAGATLAFGGRRSGLRSCLAVRGGFAVPAVLGSRSTHVRSSIGGWHGRALQKGDRLPLADAALAATAPRPPVPAARRLLRVLASRPPASPLRAMTGRDWDRFGFWSQEVFFGEAYRIGAQSDRMGYRLEGMALRRRDPGELLSEAVAFGSVQVPGDGQPIVLMADRQSTGGYPRIAQVAGVDLPALAQAEPGREVRFERIAHEAAERLLLERAGMLAALRRQLLGEA